MPKPIHTTVGSVRARSFAAASVLAADPATPGKAQTLCPVMELAIDKKVYTDYQGKRVYFCCTQCKKDFQKDPAGYVKKLDDQGVVLEKAPGAK
jgi:YHS domain-containing protein